MRIRKRANRRADQPASAARTQHHELDEVVLELQELAVRLRDRGHELAPRGKFEWMEATSWSEIAEWADRMAELEMDVGR